MKWRCRKYRNWLMHSFSEPLPQDKAEELRLHLRTCHRCRDFQAHLAAAYALLKEESEIRVPPEIEARLLAGVRNGLRSQVQGRFAPQPKKTTPAFGYHLALVAAGLAFLFFWGSFLFRAPRPRIPRAENKAIVIQSVRYRGEDANFSVFESSDRKTTFIWID